MAVIESTRFEINIYLCILRNAMSRLDATSRRTASLVYCVRYSCAIRKHFDMKASEARKEGVFTRAFDEMTNRNCSRRSITNWVSKLQVLGLPASRSFRSFHSFTRNWIIWRLMCSSAVAVTTDALILFMNACCMCTANDCGCPFESWLKFIWLNFRNISVIFLLDQIGWFERCNKLR